MSEIGTDSDYKSGARVAPPGTAKTSIEMDFAVTLRACPHCDARNWAQPELSGNGTLWVNTATCRACGKKTGTPFTTLGSPFAFTVDSYELGPGPTALISPDELLAELDRIPTVTAAPPTLAPPEWKTALAAVTRRMIVLTELAKLVPSGVDRIPNTRDARATAAWLTEHRTRTDATLDAFVADKERNAAATPKPPAPAERLTRERLSAHMRWLRARRSGMGRLEVGAIEARGVVIGAAELTAARFTGTQLAHADLRSASIDESEWTGCDLTDARLDSASFNRGTLVDTGLARASAPIVRFDDATITRCTLAGANLGVSTWVKAKVSDTDLSGATLGNAAVDGARFTGCNFSGAKWAPVQRLPKPATAARFENCDLRDVDWAGRSLDGAVFVGCKLAGSRGRATSVANVTVEDCDLDLDALRAALGQEPVEREA